MTSSKEFYRDEKTFDSVLMNFIVIGESVARLDKGFKESHPDFHGIRTSLKTPFYLLLLEKD